MTFPLRSVRSRVKSRESRASRMAAGRLVPFWLSTLDSRLSTILAILALIAGGAVSRGGELPRNAVLDFSATWCQPCQRMSPIVHKLEQQGLPIHAVDIDRYSQLAQSFNVKLVPTFVLLLDGKEAQRITGPVSEEQLRRMASQAAENERNQQASLAEQPSRSLPLTDGSQLTEASEDRQDGFTVSLGDPTAAPDFTANPSSRSAQPTPAKPTRGFPSLFSKRKSAGVPVEVAERAEPARFLGQTPEAGRELNAQALPLSVSVRLIVSDDTGSNFGSGTVIDSRAGRTVIVTCGHIFQPADDENSKAAPPKSVAVDVFQPGGRPQSYPGQLVDVDFDGDVAVVTVDTPSALPATTVADLSQTPDLKDRLLSIGCGGGEIPSAEGVRVTALNLYDGPDNIECSGVPVKGRSGGGLFDARGNLVGVCIGADQEGQRGLYAGLKPIHDLLLRSGLGTALPSSSAAANDAEPAVTAGENLAGVTNPADDSASGNSILNDAFGESEPEFLTNGASPTQDDVAQLLAAQPDAEVICIVRPKDGSAGRVLILNEPSTKFVSYLLDSFDGPATSAPMAASLRVEDPSAPLGNEWVPDDDLGVPKRAPNVQSNRRGRKSRFGSRSED